MVQDGDENTKFFHLVANGRKNRNFIPRFTHGGNVLINSKDIGKAFESRFKTQFGCKRDF